MDEYTIIRRPMITEKGTTLKEQSNQLVFEVALNSTKPEIKKAVEKLFKVTVLSVRTQNRDGKPKRLGRHMGRRRHWKKAVVTLKEGHRVEFFEGV